VYPERLHKQSTYVFGRAVIRLWVLTFLLAGCAAPPPQAESYKGSHEGTWKASNDLSDAREKQLGDAFIGREYAFRVLWHEYAVVDPDPDLNAPCPLRAITSSSAGMAVNVPAGTASRGHLVVAARPGETATITGIGFGRSSMTIFSRKPNGVPVFLIVTMPRGRTILLTKTSDCADRQKISDENLTVAWLENVLSQSVLEFIAASPPAVRLPEAQKGLVLSPPKPSNDAVSPGKPSVALLSAYAEPAQVKRGGVVRLSMAFRVNADSTRKVQVSESYELSFEGKPLPNFPVQRTQSRDAGEHNGVYSQQIPNGAAPGTYRFKAEVCFDGTCSSKVSSFEIGP
jgi:hypothetical protein